MAAADTADTEILDIDNLPTLSEDEGTDTTEATEEGAEETADEKPPEVEPVGEKSEESEKEEEPESTDEEEEPEAEEDEDKEPDEKKDDKEESKSEEEDLPEGVTLDKDGKWTYPPERGRTIYDGYKAHNEIKEAVSEVLGEDEFTAEDAKRIAKHSRGWLMFHDDFQSGDPNLQYSVFRSLIDSGQKAFEEGRVKQDPVPVGVATLMTMVERDHPDIYREIVEKPTIEGTLNALEKQAKSSDDKNLKVTVDNVRWYLNKGKPTAVDNEETNEYKAKAEKLQKELDDRDREATDQQWKTYEKDLSNDLRSAITDAVEEPFKGIEIADDDEQGKEDLAAAKALLRTRIGEAFKSEKSWREANEELLKQAGRASSEKVLTGIREKLAKRYGAKAKSVVNKSKPRLLSRFADKKVKASEARRGRLKKGAAQKGISSGAGEPDTPKPKVKTEFKNRDDFEAHLKTFQLPE